MESQEQRARGEKFRSLHAGPDLLLLPNAWDGGSAVLMEKAGFQAIATTSSGIAFAQGRPDGERIGRARMLEVVARIAERVSIPVSADLETGYGDSPEDVAETIRQAIAAGAVGANVEDGTTDGTAPLLPLEHAAERLRAARAAADAGGVPFVLNGRTDPYLRLREASPEERFAETVRRAHAYQEAGADCIFVPGVADAASRRQVDDPRSTATICFRSRAGVLTPSLRLGGRQAPPTAAAQARQRQRTEDAATLEQAGKILVRRVLSTRGP
jgi:2-methylisocitrate lyase-like PEP mutase family enzyme